MCSKFSGSKTSQPILADCQKEIDGLLRQFYNQESYDSMEWCIQNKDRLAALYNQQGVEYYINNQLSMAVDCFTTAIGWSDSNPIFDINLGMAYERQGNYMAALINCGLYCGKTQGTPFQQKAVEKYKSLLDKIYKEKVVDIQASSGATAAEQVSSTATAAEQSELSEDKSGADWSSKIRHQVIDRICGGFSR